MRLKFEDAHYAPFKISLCIGECIFHKLCVVFSHSIVNVVNNELFSYYELILASFILFTWWQVL